MPRRDQNSFSYDTWKGMYQRQLVNVSGSSTNRYQVPPGYASFFGNAVWADGVPTHRPGTEYKANWGHTLWPVVRQHRFRLDDSVDRFLVLRDNGKLYDSVFSMTTEILSIASMVDFSVQIISGRAYITPHDRHTGIVSQFVYVWDPATMTVARKAAGAKPTGTFTAAVSATNGNTEPGLHILAVAYEFDTGFITKPALYTSVTAPSGTKKKIDLSVIPTGPTGVVARHILMSRVVKNSDGNLEAPELFFAQRLGDNTTTALTGANGIDYYDSQLVASADYLKDVLEEIPAGVCIGTYQGRLAVGGESGDDSLLRASLPGDWETFRASDGFVVVPDEGGGVKNFFEQRGILYILKSNITYGTQDNGLSPNRWQVVTVDAGIGGECFSVSVVPVTRNGHIVDTTFVAHISGFYEFNGRYSERRLSHNIQGWWRRQVVNQDFTKMQVCIDPYRKVVLILLPNTNGFSFILHADYENGLTWEGIRWSTWDFYRTVNCIMLDIWSVSKTPVLYLGTGEGIHWMVDQESGAGFVDSDVDQDGVLHPIQMSLTLAPLGTVEDLGDTVIEGVRVLTQTRVAGDDAQLSVGFVPLDQGGYKINKNVDDYFEFTEGTDKRVAILDPNNYFVDQLATELETEMNEAGLLPSSLSPSVWFAADKITLPPSAGHLLDHWNDISGNGRDLAQATAALKPYWIEQNEISGRPTVVFGAGTRFGSAATMADILDANGHGTIYIVFKLLAGGTGVDFLFGQSNGNRGILYDGTNTAARAFDGTQDNAVIATARDETWHIATFMYDGVNVTVSVDDQDTAALVGTASGAQTDLAQTLVMGSDGTNHADAHIAEVIGFATEHTEEERRRITRYLTKKYDIVDTTSAPTWTNTYTVSYSVDTKKFVFTRSAGAATFSIPFATMKFPEQSVRRRIGFDLLDLTGAATYSGNYVEQYKVYSVNTINVFDSEPKVYTEKLPEVARAERFAIQILVSTSSTKMRSGSVLIYKVIPYARQDSMERPA